MPIVPAGGDIDGLDSDLHIQQTIAFIEQNPIDITLNRRVKQSTPSGGWKWSSGGNLDPITVRLVGLNRVSATVQRTTEDGRVVVPTLALVAHPLQDINVGDVFTHNGDDHEIITADNEHPPWRLQAEVLVHG